MRRPTRSRSTLPRRRGLGFTLIELMIVVAIIAILAATAISAYGKYIVDARISEAITLMSDIRTKEEAYYNMWGQYKAAGWNPTAVPDDTELAWADSNDWKELGVTPSGGVFWRFRVQAYPAGTSNDMATNRNVDTTRDWYYVEAESNLDSNTSTAATQIVVDSQTDTPSYANKGQ